MAREKILVIEDEDDIRHLIEYNLSREGFRVFQAASGEEGLKMARGERPNLVLLDLMLPGLDGLEVCKILKHDPDTHKMQIIMVSAKGEEADIVTGLEVGADDYVSKPFSPKILVARVRSVLRRVAEPQLSSSDRVVFKELSIDPGRREALIGKKSIDLTFTEFQMLHLFARKPGWVFTRYQIVNAVRGEDVIVTDRSVDVQIVGLRKKLGSWGKQIETVRGVGYRLKE
ncbi:MAG: response regulator transcription factor [Candidatus Zixiibacteriota bacterium]